MLKNYAVLTSILIVLLSPFINAQNCAPLSTSYLEDFESSKFQVVPQTSLYRNGGKIDSCWSRSDTTRFHFLTGTGTTRYAHTGPAGGWPGGLGKYLYTALGYGTANASTQIISPEIDLSTTTHPQLRFWYHMYGNEIDSLIIEAGNGTNWQVLDVIKGQQQFAIADAWKESIQSLTSFTNDTIRIRFTAVRKLAAIGGDGNIQFCIALDNIWIGDSTACQAPYALSAIGKSESSVELNWISRTGAAGSQISYGPAGTPPGTGTIVNTSYDSIIISGLNPNSTYHFYIKDSCISTGQSNWIGPVGASTLCLPATAPFSENFDGNSWPATLLNKQWGISVDPCWRRDDTVSYFFKTFTSITGNSYNNGPPGDHTTGNGKYLTAVNGNFIQPTDVSATLYSPLIDLDTLDMPQLRFWYHMYGTGIDRLSVEVRAEGDWQLVKIFTGAQQVSITSPWKEAVVSLAPFKGDTIQVRIVGKRKFLSLNANSISIDDFQIVNAPTCPESEKLVATAISDTAVQLNWLSGGASNWQIAYRILGSSNPFTIIQASAKPFILGGLSSNTTYEIMVRDSCGLGDTGPFSISDTVTTLCGYISFPYLENFDGPNWVIGNMGSNANNQIDDCWYRQPLSSPSFGPYGSPTFSTNTGPLTDYSGTGKFLYTEASDGVGAGKINMPLVIVPDSADKPYLKFAYHMYGSDIHSLKVKIDNGKGAGLVNVWQLTGQQQTSSAAAWKLDSISLGDYANDTITIQFIGRNTGYNGDVAIDEVELKFCSPVNANIQNQNSYLSIGFDTTATSGASHFVWDFGNGKTDSTASPVNVYDSAGTYHVSLYAYNSCGKNDTVFKTITVCDTLYAGFSTSVNGDTLFYHADSSNNAIGFKWNLDDGKTSTAQGSYLVYDSTGYKTITLTSYNSCGDTITSTKNIAVCPKPIAHWSYDTLPPIGPGLRVQFTTNNSKYANHYYWDFGDGQTGTGPSPIHTYSTASYHYRVVLTVKNGCGDTDTLQSRLRHIDLDEVRIADQIHLYPNPTNGLVRINAPGRKLHPTNVSVYNNAGHKIPVKTVTVGNSELEVSLYLLPPGVYFIKVHDHEGDAVYKVIKTE